MLPYAPVHHLILREGRFRALVMTSANRGDEPMATVDADAIERLGGLADVFLTHDRPIETRCDDSVVRPLGAGAAEAIVLRRSRGYAPLPVHLRGSRSRPTLAVGGDLKSTFALAAGERAVLSHHLGDLQHYPAYRSYGEAIAHYERIYRIAPRLLVHDLHPDYASTRYALDRARTEGVELLAVQHHHAHMASCLVENEWVGPAIGVCFDGAGLGLDGTIWGGEFLVGDARAATRVAHLRAVRMPGGDAASREPWRMAVAHMVFAGVDEGRSGVVRRVGAARAHAVRAMLDRGVRSPWTSSVGRLFDAVASLAGVCDDASFEGQAAMRLEALARVATDGTASGYSFGLDATATLIDAGPVIRAVVEDANRGATATSIARRFHTGLVEAIAAACTAIGERHGVRAVALSGGVFSNAILVEEASARLRLRGFRVLRHRTVPPNDGGLSLGQLAIAAAAAEVEAPPCV
jgi:hydrogenase maturation protein HypF